MPTPLSPSTIEIVKASVPALAEHGPAITRSMYARLFRDEHIRALFNHSNQGEGGSQVNALAAAILAYAQNIENPSVLMPVLERIAHKHIGYHILPEHYPFVATALLEAIADVLGKAATPELITAWGEAYWFLADVLKEREAAIRAEIESRQGGWSGWRPFKIVAKTRESDVVTSFVMRPVDDAPVIPHRPGQYLTFRLRPPGVQEIKRNYSISCGPNNTSYQISVKREAMGQGGSKFLHDSVAVGDILEATPPAGDFYLAEDPGRPVVLLSGGVGLTPMVSMVEEIARAYPDLQTHYVHGALNSSTHAMDRHVRTVAQRHGSISVHTFYSDPLSVDALGVNHDHQGFITGTWLRNNVPFHDADYYLCGPKPFLKALVRDLADNGVDASRIHFEVFGPTDEQMAA